jgi:hypothetical protein
MVVMICDLRCELLLPLLEDSLEFVCSIADFDLVGTRKRKRERKRKSTGTEMLHDERKREKVLVLKCCTMQPTSLERPEKH